MLNIILKLAGEFYRIDVITGRYLKNSMKSDVRKKRRKGSRKLFQGESLFPKNVETDFLFNDENKDDLNNFLADVCWK